MTTVVFCLLCFGFFLSSRSSVWYHCLSHISAIMSLRVNVFLNPHLWKRTKGQVLSAGDFLLFLHHSVCPLLLSVSLILRFKPQKMERRLTFSLFLLLPFSSPPSLFYSLCPLVEKSQKDQKDPGEPFCLTNYLKKTKKKRAFPVQTWT